MCEVYRQKVYRDLDTLGPTKCCACHEICTSRFVEVHKVLCLPRNRTSRFTKCCACHEICASRFTKCCACHEITLQGSQSAAPVTKSAHRGSQSAVPATKSARQGSQCAAPATNLATPARKPVLNAAPRSFLSRGPHPEFIF